jgi:hypothetical protein
MAATGAFARTPMKISSKNPFRFVQNSISPTPATTPLPTAPDAGAPMVVPGGEPVPAAGAPVTLYHCVRVKDECNIAPCAVPQIVMVKDPCAVCDPCNPCAAPKCVAVQICVPPCSECPPRVTCKRDGEYVKYDYGKYRVEITSRKGVVTVDYDD